MGSRSLWSAPSGRLGGDPEGCELLQIVEIDDVGYLNTNALFRHSCRRELQEANPGEERSSSEDKRTNRAAEAVNRLTHRQIRAKALWGSGRRGSIRSSMSAARGRGAKQVLKVCNPA